MDLTRRDFLASAPALLAAAAEPFAPRLGAAIDSFPVHRAADKEFAEPLSFLEYCHGLGAAGFQVPLGDRDEAYTTRLRERAAALGMYVEGSVRLPRDAGDVERFTAEVRTAKACGADVLRTVLLTGRRYEVFDSLDAFNRAAEGARRSLALAKPVIERHGVRLAVENHKEFLAPALAEMLRAVDSANVGVCLDFGNSVALLEPPLETAEILAPLTFTSHIKDMGVDEYADGFLLSELPLGKGFLDLAGIIALVRKSRPEARFNLEMITRDPLRIPCLTEKYWATLGEIQAPRLARMLALVRSNAKGPLPRVSGLSRAEQLQREDENVAASFRYARERLGL